MPLAYPCGSKDSPDGVIAPAAPVTVVREPVMTISYPSGCYGEAEFTIDRMPTMDREPETIPDIPGNFPSVLEYLDMGVAPGGGGATPWVGRGAQQWDVYVDGVVLGDFSGLHFDGDVGPFTTTLIAEVNWSLPHTFWMKATYFDRPPYEEFWMGPGTGVIAFKPESDPRCASIGTIGWNDLGYWDPWVDAHHGVSDVLGPVDRHGDYLPLTGPWGSDVPQQHLASPGCDLCGTVGVPNGSAFATSLFDFTERITYPEISYPVESGRQELPTCIPTRPAHPVFRNRHKSEAL